MNDTQRSHVRRARDHRVSCRSRELALRVRSGARGQPASSVGGTKEEILREFGCPVLACGWRARRDLALGFRRWPPLTQCPGLRAPRSLRAHPQTQLVTTSTLTLSSLLPALLSWWRSRLYTDRQLHVQNAPEPEDGYWFQPKPYYKKRPSKRWSRFDWCTAEKT